MINTLYDDGVPAVWLRLQENHPEWSEPSFPHLEVALAPRIVAVPAAQENGASNRLMPQPDKVWHPLDPSSFSQPAYQSERQRIKKDMRPFSFNWKVDSGLATVPDLASKAELRQEKEGATTASAGAAALVDACIRGDQQAVQALIWEGTDVNARDHHGLTPLDHAIDHTQFVIAETLTAAGAVWTRSRKDATALLIPAVNANLPRLLRCALGAGADITATDRDGRTPLHHAVLNMRHAFLPCLANLRTAVHEDALGNTPLHLAALACNQPALKALLAWRAGLNVRNRDGNTALSCACTIASANSADSADSVMLLIRAGADITLENRLGQRPLHIACLHGQTAIVRMLLALGADPDVRTAHGETALAIARRVNSAAIVTALTLGGATD